MRWTCSKGKARPAYGNSRRARKDFSVGEQWSCSFDPSTCTRLLSCKLSLADFGLPLLRLREPQRRSVYPYTLQMCPEDGYSNKEDDGAVCKRKSVSFACAGAGQYGQYGWCCGQGCGVRVQAAFFPKCTTSIGTCANVPRFKQVRSGSIEAKMGTQFSCQATLAFAFTGGVHRSRPPKICGGICRMRHTQHCLSAPKLRKWAA